MRPDGVRPELFEADAAFRSLIENASDIITILEADGSIRYESPSLERVLGYRPHELLGKNVFDFIHPHDVSRLLDIFDAAKKALGFAPPVEFRFRHKDGSWRVLQSIAKNLLDDPAIQGIVVNSRDMTERRRTEEALRTSEEKYRGLFEAMREGFALCEIICDKSGNPCDYRYLEANAAYEKLLCVQRSQALGKTVREIFPQVEPYWIELFGNVALTGVPARFENYFQTLGRHFEVEAFSPRHGQFAAIFTDITERKRTETALRESEELFRSLSASSPLGIYLADLEGRSTYVNPRTRELCGFTLAESMDGGWANFLHPDDREATVQSWLDYVKRGAGDFSYETRYQHRDGTTYRVQIRAAPMQSDDGKPMGFVGTIEDITARKLAEEKLRDSEYKYRILVDKSTDGIFTVDDQWNIQFANPAMCQMSGYTQAEFQQLNVLDTYPPEERDTAKRRRQILHAVPLLQFERTFLRKDGTRFPVEVSVNRVEENCFHAVVRDITDRKRAEETRLRLAAIVESSHDAIVSTNLEGTVISWNAAAERLFGHTAGEIIGQSIVRIIAEDRHQEKDEVLQRACNGEHIHQFESFTLTKDGRRIPVSLTVSPIKDAAENIVGTSAIIHDITERKRDEEQLRLLSAALEAAANGIVITDCQGCVLWVNPAFTTLTGYTADEVLGKNPRVLRSGQHDKAFYQDLWQTVQSGRVWHGDMINRRKDGSLYNEEMTITPVRNSAGAVTRFIAIKQDVTVRKHSEEQLRESKQRLEHALEELQTAQQQVVQQERLRALGTMASGIAHDFNNALAAILGFTELLLHRPENLNDKAKVIRYLELMNTAAKDAGHIVNRLREFYRHREEGEVFMPVDLNRLVEEAISLTQPKWKAQAEARGVTITAETELQELPPVFGNAADLREVLTNLMFNAVDAMTQGGKITLRTRADEAHVTLEITDTGTGMTEEVRRRCLEPFFTTKGVHGTGLGLSMVYGIIQRHEGTVDIRTELGKGTTFIISLPVRAEAQPPQETESTPAPAAPLRVLLVDDEELVRKILNEFLIGDGHDVTLAANGEEALVKFRDGQFDLVFVDRAMPGMSGDQVAAAIKGASPAMPIIMLTGFGGMMEASDETPSGVDLVVGKPVTMAKLRAAVATVVVRR